MLPLALGLATIADLPFTYAPFRAPAPQSAWAQAHDPVSGARYWQPLAPGSLFALPGGAARRRAYARAWAPYPVPAGCPRDMVLAEGLMHDPLRTAARQNKACLDGPAWNPKYLCQKFDARALGDAGPGTIPVRACVDRFEWPNVP